MSEQQTDIKDRNARRKKIIGWSKAIIIFYCSIGIALYYLQEKFMFHPETLPTDYQFKFSTPFRELSIPMNKTDTINIVQFLPPSGVAKGVVLYFHGNRGNINRYAKYAVNFTKNDYQVWMIDYPGYGKSTGKLTEESLYKQALELYKLANSKFSGDSIILYGKSLGSGIAAFVASKKINKRLILETPYYSMTDLFHHYAPVYPTGRMGKFKIPTFSYLRSTRSPITIFHGTDDGVVPYANGSKLKRSMKKGDEFVTIQGGSHNNLNDFEHYHAKLDSLLQ